MRFLTRVTATLLTNFLIYHSKIDFSKFLDTFVDNPAQVNNLSELLSISMILLTNYVVFKESNNAIHRFFIQPVDQIENNIVIPIFDEAENYFRRNEDDEYDDRERMQHPLVP